MNQRDQDLLDKQLHAVYVPPRNEGVLILAVLAVFFAGVALGGFVFAYSNEPGPLHVAANVPHFVQQ